MIEKVYDDYLMKDFLANKREERISISELGKCLRYLMMLDKGGYESIVPDKYQLRTFRHGKIIEKDIVEALRSEGKLIAEQIAVEYRGITGTIDWIVFNEEMNCNYLYDGKTAKESSFQYLDRIHNEMGEDYKYQLTGYYHSNIMSSAVTLRNKYNLNKTSGIAYISKDNSLFYEPTLACEDFKGKLDERVDEILYWRTKKELPPELTKWEKSSWGKDEQGRKLKIKSWCGDVGFPCFTLQKEQYTRKVCGVKAWCSKIKNCPRVTEAYKKQCAEFGIKE